MSPSKDDDDNIKKEKTNSNSMVLGRSESVRVSNVNLKQLQDLKSFKDANASSQKTLINSNNINNSLSMPINLK